MILASARLIRNHCSHMGTMPPSVATTSTLAMLRTVESRGFETRDLLAAAALARETVEDPDARLPGPVVMALWNALRERSGDPLLQLAAPTILPFGAYRVIDYMVDASDTVGAGMERFARFFGLIAEATRITIEAEGDERRLQLALADGGAVPPLYVDYVFAALVGRIRMKIRPELLVRRVELRHPAPPDPGPYSLRFRAPVLFDAAADRLCFDSAEWDAPLRNADAALAHLLDEHARMLAARLPDAPGGLQAAVRQALTATLPDTQAASVAHALHVSVRTLQRRLAADGTTFRDIADSLRRGLAEAYLGDPHVSIAEVAFLLGFSDQTSFNRAFRRWTGAAPGAWRRRPAGQVMGGGAPPGVAGRQTLSDPGAQNRTFKPSPA
jgi:AraC-like DNA-binding protein